MRSFCSGVMIGKEWLKRSQDGRADSGPPHRAAVDRNGGTVDVAGERRGEERHEVADVVRLAEVPGGNVLLDVIGARLLGRVQLLDLRAVDAARRDRVDRDAVAAEFGGEGA